MVEQWLWISPLQILAQTSALMAQNSALLAQSVRNTQLYFDWLHVFHLPPKKAPRTITVLGASIFSYFALLPA